MLLHTFPSLRVAYIDEVHTHTLLAPTIPLYSITCSRPPSVRSHLPSPLYVHHILPPLLILPLPPPLPLHRCSR